MEGGALRRLTSIFYLRCEKRLANVAPPSDQSLPGFAQGKTVSKYDKSPFRNCSQNQIPQPIRICYAFAIRP
jgi:hypothetical protein